MKLIELILKIKEEIFLYVYNTQEFDLKKMKEVNIKLKEIISLINIFEKKK